MNRKHFVYINFAIIFSAILIVLILNKSTKMSCIFCDIVNKKTDTEILFEDELFIAFRDIRPASNFHFLIIPKKHIINTNALTVDDKTMLLQMKEAMLDLLAKNDQTDLNDISLGFHIPPFNSVKHLHLHGISKKSDMRFIAKMIFKENSFWYKTFDTVLDSLPAAKM